MELKDLLQKGVEKLKEQPDKPQDKWGNGQWVVGKQSHPQVDKSQKQLQDELKLQDKLYKELDKIRQCFNKGTEINELILRYEQILTPANIPLIKSQKHLLSLPELYILNNQDDKAWGFYNLLYSLDAVDRGKIRDLQAKMLKKDKKHREAIEMYLMKHAENASWKVFDRQAVLKDIGVPARALKWSEEAQNTIVDILQRNLTNQRTMITEYRSFIERL